MSLMVLVDGVQLALVWIQGCQRAVSCNRVICGEFGQGSPIEKGAAGEPNRSEGRGGAEGTWMECLDVKPCVSGVMGMKTLIPLHCMHVHRGMIDCLKVGVTAMRYSAVVSQVAEGRSQVYCQR
jgi:hypothetical protein